MTHFDVPGPIHREWTTKHTPVIEIADGDTVSFELTEASGEQFDRSSTSSRIATFDPAVICPLAGPIVVAGAEPGDAIEIEFLELKNLGWGWTAVLPGFGLLSDDFPEPHLHIWDFDGRDDTDFLDVAKIPLHAFPGIIGLCPDTEEPIGVVPPGNFGGNLDCRDLTTGSRLYLPVQVPGGRLALGDPHAAQGDGEVCGSAIEASLTGTIKVRLHKDKNLSFPQVAVARGTRAGTTEDGYFATMGVAPDLMQASQDAVRGMIDHLGKTYGLEPVDAYVLCSAAVDLKITEIVDAPNWVVSAYLPNSIMTR